MRDLTSPLQQTNMSQLGSPRSRLPCHRRNAPLLAMAAGAETDRSSKVKSTSRRCRGGDGLAQSRPRRQPPTMEADRKGQRVVAPHVNRREKLLQPDRNCLGVTSTAHGRGLAREKLGVRDKAVAAFALANALNPSCRSASEGMCRTRGRSGARPERSKRRPCRIVGPLPCRRLNGAHESERNIVPPWLRHHLHRYGQTGTRQFALPGGLDHSVPGLRPLGLLVGLDPRDRHDAGGKAEEIGDDL